MISSQTAFYDKGTVDREEERWENQITDTTGLDKQKNQLKIVNMFLPINLNICFWCAKEQSH